MEGAWVSLRIVRCHCNIIIVIIFTLCKFIIGGQVMPPGLPDIPKENTMGKFLSSALCTVESKYLYLQ